MRNSFLIMTVLGLSFLWGCGPDDSDNRRPTARLSSNSITLQVGQTVTIDGSQSSDPDGDPLIHRWELRAPSDSSATLSRRRGESVSITPDVDGDYFIELVVDDGALESSDMVAVRARERMNLPPVADAGDNITTEPGLEVTLDASASADPNGDTLRYEWSVSRPMGSQATPDSPNQAQTTFTPDVAGTYYFEVEVEDPDGVKDTARVAVEAVQTNPNDPPVAEAGDPQTVDVDTEVVLDGNASSDPNNHALTFQWALDSAPTGSSAGLQSATTMRPTLTPDVEGEYVVSLTVDDGEATDTDTVTVTATPPLPCLIISEMYEGASYNKAVEVFNCSDESIDLTDFGYCLVQNDNTTCSKQLMFEGQLASDEVRLYCHPDLSWNAAQTDLCSVRDTVLNFNGDDRMFFFEDVDESGNYTTQDTVIDAFGEISNQPGTTPWADGDYRRCNFEQFHGMGPFDHTIYYERVDIGDMSHLGAAPSEGCN